MAYVYRHIRLDKNEPFYIGIGSDEKHKRAYTTDSRNKIWKSIVSRTNFEIEIILDNISWEDACKKEIEFIDLYKRKCDNGILANLSYGGEGGVSGFKRSQENKDKISNYNKGKKRPKIVGEKISLKLKGIKRSDAFKETIKNRMIGNSYTLGMKISDEHKAKISMANKGVKQKIVQCPYCDIKGGNSVMKRFHFDNCKKK
jgi:hypothetical protein